MDGNNRSSVSNVFTRYELIAIAMPGAMFLLGLWYVNPALIHGFEPKDATIGALGIFTIASFCLGHILQLVTIIVNQVTGRVRGEPSDRVLTKLPQNMRDEIPSRLAQILGVPEAEVRAAKSLRPYFFQIIAVLRAQGDIEMLEIFTLARGLHKGLSVAFFLLAVAAALCKEPWLSLVFAILLAATIYMASFYTERYSKQMWLQFLRLKHSEGLSKNA